MNDILFTLADTLIFILVLQPFASLQILPFRKFLSRTQQKEIACLWGILILLETVCFTILLRQNLFPDLAIAYWSLGYLAWVPQFFLSFFFTRKFWVGHLFILSFRTLFSSIFYTFMRHFFLAFFPDVPFEQLYFWEILFYGGLSLLAFPLLLWFFAHVFADFQEASTRRYWRLITVIPILLAIETLYISLSDSQEKYFSLLFSRVLLLIVVLLLIASIRSGQREVYEELGTYEKNHELQQQLVSAVNYVKMSKASKQRMAGIYQEKIRHINKLLALVRQKDRDGVLHYISELGEVFNSTKLPRYCQNVLINAALTVYFSKARELQIPVTVSVDLPQDLSYSGDLSIVLSNLVENALLASQKQPSERRNITVLALRQGDMLNILVKNMFDEPVMLGEEGLPVTQVKGHGIGMKSLMRFRDKYEANVLCQQKDGWFMTYLRLPLVPAGPGN